MTRRREVIISRLHNSRKDEGLVRTVIGGLAAAMLVGLAGCGPNYSPNTYSSAAVQQANKVTQGEVVGVRKVGVVADATLGTATGAAAGGIAGSQVGTGPFTALSTLGGTVIGGIVGSGVEHAEGDTNAYEYIVQQNDGTLVSVTQKDTVPLAVGEKVLVIAGKQARVVPDYTVTVPGLPAKPVFAHKPGTTVPMAGATPAPAAISGPPGPHAAAGSVSASTGTAPAASAATAGTTPAAGAFGGGAPPVAATPLAPPSGATAAAPLTAAPAGSSATAAAPPAAAAAGTTDTAPLPSLPPGLEAAAAAPPVVPATPRAPASSMATASGSSARSGNESPAPQPDAPISLALPPSVTAQGTPGDAAGQTAGTKP